jgi:transcriptional regulator with XRE-family HTH domain
MDDRFSGDKLKKIREDANFSTSDLARRLHASPSTISKIESGDRDPSRDVLLRWLEACGKELAIVGATPPEARPAPRSEGAEMVMDALEGLDEDDLPIIAKALRGLKAAKGEDHALARANLKWLASRAEAVGSLPSAEELMARLERLEARESERTRRLPPRRRAALTK